eukprot:TRINITY_DN74438_c0_g1_i1.p1 TRINITY_DN74438_c0_g1~~TRINITY_DN74438_c0_g1_i1.p1  ORF type:complete len:749 (-),score=60.74 TRINITY_DN74438_c0_g1_i1:138-2048(-)
MCKGFAYVDNTPRVGGSLHADNMTGCILKSLSCTNPQPGEGRFANWAFCGRRTLPPLRTDSFDISHALQMCGAPLRGMSVVTPDGSPEAAAPPRPVKVLVLSSDGERLESDFAKVILKGLENCGYISLQAFISSGMDRAVIAKGTCDELDSGRCHVPVGWSDTLPSCGLTTTPNGPCLQDLTYLQKDFTQDYTKDVMQLSLASMDAVLRQVFEHLEESELTIVSLGPFTDLATILNNPAYRSKVAHIVALGSVQGSGDELGVGDLHPTEASFASRYDFPATQYVFQQVQRHGSTVSLTIVQDTAAQDVVLSYDVYEYLARHSKIGRRLVGRTLADRRDFWKDSAYGNRFFLTEMSLDSSTSPSAPFIKEYISSEMPGPTPELWDMLKANSSFTCEECLVMLAAVPVLRELLFSPLRLETPGSTTLGQRILEVIGLEDQTLAGVKDTGSLRHFMYVASQAAVDSTFQASTFTADDWQPSPGLPAHAQTAPSVVLAPGQTATAAHGIPGATGMSASTAAWAAPPQARETPTVILPAGQAAIPTQGMPAAPISTMDAWAPPPAAFVPGPAVHAATGHPYRGAKMSPNGVRPDNVADDDSPVARWNELQAGANEEPEVDDTDDCDDEMGGFEDLDDVIDN